MDQNFLLVGEEGEKYVLKIMNAEDSKDTTLLGLQTLAMSFLRSNGILAQTALPTKTGQLMTMVEAGNTRYLCSPVLFHFLCFLLLFFLLVF